MLHSVLVREEAAEVRGYLSLYRQARPGSTADALQRLATESAHHAETLAQMAGSIGEPWHRTRTGGLLRNVVYGFNDGLTANFGLVAGVVGAQVDVNVIIVTGVAGIVADALSMGASGYLAAKSEREVYEHEIAMEREELRFMPDLEEQELALLYQTKGMAQQPARDLARELMKSPDQALEVMTREELGIAEQRISPIREGWITGAATAIGALVPVLPFLILPSRVAVWTSFAVAMGSHFAVGAARSVLTGRGMLRSGMDMFLVGLGVAAVGYLVGDVIVKHLFV
ncbi:MAG: VIT1/CCC1 transporter family protein [Spirochaetaceae bacterium]|nr:VIT1/CCC1 transporter family protein [Spirochaetaceae bacterium]